MPITVSITDITGSVKKIAGSNANLRDSFADLWNNANASSITTPYTVPSSAHTILLHKGSGSITISISPDSGMTDGQGVFLSPMNQVEVTAVSGTLYFTSSKYLNYDDDAEDAYGNSNHISMGVGDSVADGYLLCSNTSSFSIRIDFVGNGGIKSLGSDTRVVIIEGPDIVVIIIYKN